MTVLTRLFKGRSSGTGNTSSCNVERSLVASMRKLAESFSVRGVTVRCVAGGDAMGAAEKARSVKINEKGIAHTKLALTFC